jgi:acyl carrier protein
MNSQERTDKLRQTLSAVLGVAETDLSDDSSPDSLPSWDSVTHLNLVVSLEEAFNVAFSPEETMELTSLRLIRLMLDEKLGQA